jgi:LacI family transcriptional regulator
VLFTSGTQESAALREAVTLHSPVVMLNRSVPDLPGDQVTSDNAGGAAAVAEHFVSSGHTRIGFIGGPDGPSTVAERRDGFRDALSRAGVPLESALSVAGALSYDGGDAGIARLLALAEPPTAVFCVNDLTAFGALDGARRRGIDVPAQLSIIGYDDIELAGWHAFRLSTVRQPLAAMAERAVELLLARVADPERAATHQRFPAELILRSTTATRAAA